MTSTTEPDARDRAVAMKLAHDPPQPWCAHADAITAALATARAEERAKEREGCARTAERVVPRHTECGNRIAVALRARGEG